MPLSHKKLGLLRGIAALVIMSLGLITVMSNSVSAAPIAGRHIGIDCVYNGYGYCPSSPFNGDIAWHINVGDSSGVSTFSITAPTNSGDYYIAVDDYSNNYYITSDVPSSELVIHFGAANATPGGPISSSVTHGGYLYTMTSNHGSLPSDGTSVATFTVTVTTAPTVNDLAISGVTAPVTGATPVTSVTTDSQYTGTVSWSTSPVNFAPASTYTATITLTATAGNTFSGVGANSFTVAGATSVTNPSDSGVITAVFPATAGCAPGDYINNGACVHASPGTYSSGGALTSATNCPIGYYQPNFGQSSCLPADVGYYVASVGAASEVAAPIGSYVSVTGSSAPTPCPSGTTTSSTGQSACVAIAPAIVYSKPTAPSAVSAVMSAGTATVSFSPGSSGNLPTYNQIDMYINGLFAGNVCNVSGASSCPISNLGPDVSFSFTVTAINSKGSAVSALSNSVSYASPSFAMPTTTTTTTTVPPVMKTITCLKGAITKKVTALNPVCPAGYKKK